MADGLTGKARTIAQNRRKKWEMTEVDWTFIERLVKALKVCKIFLLPARNLPLLDSRTLHTRFFEEACPDHL